MSRLFRFNPEHEIALAADRDAFTPPRRAAMLRHCGGAIMGWLGSEGDYVVIEVADEAERQAAKAWLCKTAQNFGFKASPLFISDGDMRKNSRFCLPPDISALHPWGWDRTTADTFRRLRASENMLPEESFLCIVRNASHRRVSSLLTDAAINAVPEDLKPYITADIPVEVYDPATAATLINTYGHIFAKLPYSSSGRGVTDSATLSSEAFLRQISGQIRQQGSVMIERAYDKVVDFAMLFSVKDGNARLRDYSLFFNHRMTGYAGNLILPSAEIECQLTEYVPADLLHSVATTLADSLSNILPTSYSGMAGVDMMIARRDDNFILVPCVELNLRYTMGMVAASLSRRPQFRGGLMLVLPPGQNPAPGSIPLVPQNDLFNIVCTPPGDWSNGRIL